MLTEFPSPGQPFLLCGGIGTACVRPLQAWSPSAEAWTLTPADLAHRAASAVRLAARLMLDGHPPLAELLFEAGRITGFTRPMVREGLVNCLAELAAGQARPITALESDRTHILGHVLAGNLFVSGIESILVAAFAGAHSLVRTSSADPGFPLATLEALRMADPQIAATVAIGWWPQEEETLTRRLLSHCHSVVLYGADESMDAIRPLVPPSVPVAMNGSKISFAVVAPSAMIRSNLEALADALASDISVYDQQGCLSPRAVLVPANAEATADDLAALLLPRLRSFDRRLPRHKLTLAESADLARHRDACALAAALGQPARLHSAPDDPFLLTVQTAAGMKLGALNRHADIREYQWPGAAKHLIPFAPLISSIGVAAEPGSSEERAIAGAFTAPPFATTRICRVGTMQKPRFGWAHRGRILPSPQAPPASIEFD